MSINYYTTSYVLGNIIEQITDSQKQRAIELGAQLCTGEFSELNLAYPCIIITSATSKPIIVSDDQGQATVDQVQAAQTQVPQQTDQ